MNWGMTRRIDTPELLDEGNGSAFEISRSLEDLRRLNRLLFGVSVTLAPLRTRLIHLPKPVTIADVATGSGQLAQELARWARRDFQALRLFAVDLLPRHLQLARSWNRISVTPNVQLLAADALTLPFPDRSVDVITSSLFLHHLDEPNLLRFFEECRRVARRGIVMTDLWRHPLPFTLYRLLEPFLVRSPITHHDSRVSFHRAYTPGEMQSIAGRVLNGARVTLNVPSLRWVLEWWND